MDIINPNMYLPSYDESQTGQTGQKKKTPKCKNDKPPKYSHSYLIQDNIIHPHPYIMQQPNTVTINVRESIVLSNGMIFNYISTSRNQQIRNQIRNQVCECYSKESVDSRCCGICYHLCTAPLEKQCNICPIDLDDYVDSCYCKTTELPNSSDDCFCTTFCCPIKFPLFISCFLGSIFNGYINWCFSTDRNYIF